jgi:hypothetical protein
MKIKSQYLPDRVPFTVRFLTTVIPLLYYRAVVTLFKFYPR